MGIFKIALRYKILIQGRCNMDNSRYQNCHIEMKNVNKDIVAWLETVIDENNSKIDKKEWKSRYNSYVVYDYEPFCSEGFEINLKISSHNSAYLDFIKYLYDEKLHTLEYLKNCMDSPSYAKKE